MSWFGYRYECCDDCDPIKLLEEQRYDDKFLRETVTSALILLGIDKEKIKGLLEEVQKK
jgi:hypothetical protein